MCVCVVESSCILCVLLAQVIQGFQANHCDDFSFVVGLAMERKRKRAPPPTSATYERAKGCRQAAASAANARVGSAVAEYMVSVAMLVISMCVLKHSYLVITVMTDILLMLLIVS